jgi:N-acetylneuraminic acid mutarotase
MIIWGGGNNTNQALNTGARYNPSIDTWVSLTTTNAPVSRANPAAIWTGSKMIIWGGTDGLSFSTIFNDGGIYDPLADTWKSMTTVGAPIGRVGLSIVWTGSKMIIWGGEEFTGVWGFFNTGGIYDPTNDTWTPIITVGAPSPRTNHKAVWTGSKMIVWGGNNGWGSLNDGGLYDPVSDSWETISTRNAPQGRCGHTAIWTGTEMIIWGGGGSPYFNNGGRYRP